MAISISFVVVFMVFPSRFRFSNFIIQKQKFSMVNNLLLRKTYTTSLPNHSMVFNNLIFFARLATWFFLARFMVFNNPIFFNRQPESFRFSQPNNFFVVFYNGVFLFYSLKSSVVKNAENGSVHLG